VQISPLETRFPLALQQRSSIATPSAKLSVKELYLAVESTAVHDDLRMSMGIFMGRKFEVDRQVFLLLRRLW
jgi:hypothetical protein